MAAQNLFLAYLKAKLIYSIVDYVRTDQAMFDCLVQEYPLALLSGLSGGMV